MTKIYNHNKHSSTLNSFELLLIVLFAIVFGNFGENNLNNLGDILGKLKDLLFW